MVATGVLCLLGLRPPAAVAGSELSVAAAAVYTVDADTGRLTVSVDYTISNNKPNTQSGNVITYYYYDRHSVVVPGEAIALRASNSFGTLRVTEEITELQDGSEGRVASIFMPTIYYRESRSFNFTYEVPSGSPRTDGGVRVNPAYAAFGVHAFGDSDISSVEVHLPLDFEVQVLGKPMSTRETEDMVILYRNSIRDASDFASYVIARRDTALVSSIVDVAGLAVDVRAWPGDDEWASRVAETVAAGLPVLTDLVDLELTVDNIDFIQSLEPSLFGYGGWYLHGDQTIEMGEYLDDHVIIHELAHMWFNRDLFIDRWITEGLADTFAGLTVTAIGGDTDSGHRANYQPAKSSAGAIPLNDWNTPRGSTFEDDQTASREEYGYNTSYFVVRAVYDEIGTEGLQLVMEAALRDEVAYRSGPPETVGNTDGWRRFLDLLEELGGSNGAEALFREYVVAARDLPWLDQRAESREAYAALLAQARGWSTPWAVRKPMGEWEFTDARKALDAADVILDVRDDIATVAGGIDIVPPASLEASYEEAILLQDLEAGHDLGTAQLGAVRTVAEARAAVEAERGFLTRIGLIGHHPDRLWRAAADRFEADDLEAANTESATLMDLMTDANRVGKMRVMWTATGTAAVLSGAGGTWLLVRRRRPAMAGTVVESAQEK